MDVVQMGQAVVDFVREHRQWAGPIVFVLAFGESLAFVSLILPFWGMLVGIGAILTASNLNFWEILVAASIGAALGDWVSFWVGYHYHEQVARMWPFTKYPDLLPKGHAFFEKWGVWAIVFGRFWGPLRAAVPIAAGVSQMPWWPFQIANFGSAFLWAGVLLSPGSLIAKYLPFQ